MNDVYKRMVFHFFAGEDFETNTANLIHYRCLNHYQDIFDEININISVNDTSNAEFCNRVKTKLIQVLNRCKNLRLKIVANTGYYESYTFYNEILMNLNNLNGITFFGHNKGTTNFANPNYDKRSIANWICGLYYFSLNHIAIVEKEMLANGKVFYGSFLFENKKIPSVNNLEFAAAYFWTNAALLNRDFKLNNTSIPNIDARGYTEEFPGNFYKKDKLGRYGDAIFWAGDFYREAQDIIDIHFGNDKNEKKLYNEYMQQMIDGIKI